MEESRSSTCAPPQDLSERYRHPEPGVIPAFALSEESEVFARNLKLYREGRMGEDEFRRFRLQHGIYSERFQKDFVLARVKAPGGEVTAEQLERIAEISEIFSIGSAHVTTRQDFQIHWIHLDETPEVIRRLAEVGLTTREACGNTVRNVTCCYLAGVCPYEAFDVTPYTRSIARYFIRNSLNQNLPRKFKINLAGCERECSLARIGDIGIVASENSDEHGFKIFIGGGLGPGSYIGDQLEEFTPEADLLPTCKAVIRVFDRLGDREKMHRNRMRYLAHDIGSEKFREIVLKERVIVKATQPANDRLDGFIEKAAAEEVFDGSDLEEGSGSPQYQRWLSSSVVPQKQKGYFAVHIALPCGDVLADQLRKIAEIARTYSREKAVRNTPRQNIVLRWVSGSDIPKVYDELREAGLDAPGALTITSTIGCSGATSCNLAITNSHRLGKEVQRRLVEAGLDKDNDLRGTRINISGCPNSCGQHAIATIGLFGSTQRIHGVLTPAYVMLLGGRTGADARLSKIFMRVPAKRVPEAILAIVKLFREYREPGEALQRWLDRVLAGEHRLSPDALKAELEEASRTPLPVQEPEAYFDWGSKEKFIAKTARGECAA